MQGLKLKLNRKEENLEYFVEFAFHVLSTDLPKNMPLLKTLSIPATAEPGKTFWAKLVSNGSPTSKSRISSKLF